MSKSDTSHPPLHPVLRKNMGSMRAVVFFSVCCATAALVRAPARCRRTAHRAATAADDTYERRASALISRNLRLQRERERARARARVERTSLCLGSVLLRSSSLSTGTLRCSKRPLESSCARVCESRFEFGGVSNSRYFASLSPDTGPSKIRGNSADQRRRRSRLRPRSR